VEALVCDDTRQADILVTDGEHRIVVEADGPTHFVRGPDGVIVHQDGPTKLRDRLFHISGYKVLSVRVESMQLAEFCSSEFRCRLRGQLQALGPPMSLSHAGVRLFTLVHSCRACVHHLSLHSSFTRITTITFWSCRETHLGLAWVMVHVRHTASNAHD
jgi:hypothetical protein